MFRKATTPMQVTVEQLRRGPALKLIIFAVGAKGETYSTGFTVDDLALIQFDFVCNNDNTMTTSVKAKKCQTTTSTLVKLKITCDTFERELICVDNWSDPINIKEFQAANFVIDPLNMERKFAFPNPTDIKRISSFSLKVVLTVQDASHVTAPSRTLYDDQQFTDFQLSTTDGSVRVHKAILATHSELFRSLLADGSRNLDGRFNIRGVTVQTLQQLKDYVYLGTLPSVGLPELLLVAIHSKMTNLKNDCILKLASQVGAEDLDGLIDFAARNNVPDLMRAMLSVTPDSAVDGAHRTRKSRLQFGNLNYNQVAIE